MRSSPRFEGELAFLNDFAPSFANPYRHSRFLESDFEAPVWHLRFGESPLDPIDFRVALDDQRLLTDPKHHELLDAFKCWICVHDHPTASEGRVNSAAASRHKVQRTLHLIDYLLLNARQYRLAQHGMMAMSTNDMRGLLIDLGASCRVAETLYGWSGRLAQMLRDRSIELSQQDIDAVVAKVPELGVPYEDESTLGLTGQELLRVRAWLWANGYYRRARADTTFKWAPDKARLSAELFVNTLYGQQPKPTVPELLLEGADIGARECPRAPVNSRDEEDLPTDRHIAAYVNVLRPLELLSLQGMAVPSEMLKALEEPLSGHLFAVKAPGRYRSLPQEVVLDSLRTSVEFLLAHGDTLITGYLDFVGRWKRSGRPFVEFARSFDAQDFHPELRRLGVCQWCIRALPDGSRDTLAHIPPELFFRQLRANVGLYELLQVMFGAALFVVGVLSARRSGELEDLRQDCLDKSGTRIIFYNRKSSEADMREREVRPIPRVAVRAIEMLKRLASELRKLGLVRGVSVLFAAPSRMTGLPPTAPVSAYTERLMDVLCDYLETPLDDQGRRFYIRQHQLRRFFAMLFFWGGAFGGLDTLRWFLGHTDLQHLWNYISEALPGAVLRGAKAQFAVGEVLKNSPEATDLANLLETHYGTRDFSVLEAEELNQYVEELILQGDVAIEPEFINLPDGRSYRILILVRKA